MSKSSKNQMTSFIGITVATGGILWFLNKNKKKIMDIINRNKDDDSNHNDNKTTDNTTNSTAIENNEKIQNIMELISQNPELSTLETLLKSTPLDAALDENGPFTIFAPLNESFSKLPLGTLDNLLKEENNEQLKSILSYHVLNHKIMANDITNGQTATTLQGDDLIFKRVDGKVYVVDADANQYLITAQDKTAKNGVLHIIDGVLLP